MRCSRRFALAPLTLMIATLHSARAEEPSANGNATVLPQVNVTATAVGGNSPAAEDVATRRVSSSDTTSLLLDIPGVAAQSAGGVSSLPVVHGLADDRLRIKTDGVDTIASCPNHMNSPLSYVDPTNVGRVKVYAGITPVSLGGDSIGGTIVVDSPKPVFAASGETLFQGEVGAFYRGNGGANGVNVSATYATDALNVTYAGAVAKADDYKAAKNYRNFTATGNGTGVLAANVVGSSSYKTNNHSLSVALRGGDNLIEAKLSVQDIPYEWYPNQRMDMLDNSQERLNLRYLGQMAWGTLEAQLYDETVKHYMNFGDDKQLVYGTAINGMPMNTEGKTIGANIKANIDLADQAVLRIGGEYQHYALNDWWPPSGTAGMSPGTFWNISDGKRDRMALFGEWEKRFDPQWLALLGARFEQVKTDAGDVLGYARSAADTSYGMTHTDEVTFNALDHKRTDNNVDLTALAKYTRDAGFDIDFGFARKVRSPNLYERYTWSTWAMAAVMNNTVGDGNGYFGNPDLKPEKAHTISATFDWHAADHGWEFKAAPYYTRVSDYIDAVQWTGNSATGSEKSVPTTNAYSVLRYKNQAARLYGVDLSGQSPLGKTGLGDLGIKGMLSYTNGKNLDTGGGLYNVMPLNVKLTLTQQLGGWDNGVEFVAVAPKRDVSTMRNEIRTPGYALVNLRASYSWAKTRVDFGVENLFDRLYYLPLGGAYVGQGRTMSITGVPWGIAVPGPGRSVYAGVNVKF